jgi:hypothetical protein
MVEDARADRRVKQGQFAPKYVVLHVGCGPNPSEDLPQMFPPALWTELRLDINPAAKPDIVGSMMDLHMIEDGAIDGIFSSSNLEHVYAHEVVRTLAEFVRVLQPKGLLVVGVPDLRQIAEQIIADRLEDPAFQAPAGPIAPIDMLYGHRGFVSRGMEFMAHKTGFTATSLRRVLEDSGFPQVTITELPWRLFAVACKVRTEAPEATP